jgi:hypothetical protein
LNPDWINRRVQTFTTLDTARWSRSVSLDIDIAALRRLGQAAGIPGDDLWVPLDIIDKGLLIDFSVRDSDNRPLSLTTSDETALIWVEIILSSLKPEQLGAEEDTALLHKEIKACVEPMLAAQTLQVSTELLNMDHGEEDFKTKILDFVGKLYSPDEIDHRDNRPLATKRQEAWRSLLEDPSFFSKLLTAIMNFIPLVRIRAAEDRLIVKYHYIGASRATRITAACKRIGLVRRTGQGLAWRKIQKGMQHLRDKKKPPSFRFIRSSLLGLTLVLFFYPLWLIVATRFILPALLDTHLRWLARSAGLTCLVGQFEMASVGLGSREHTRVVAPPGMVCRSQALTRRAKDQPALVPPGAWMATRLTSERAITYTRGFPSLLRPNAPPVPDNRIGMRVDPRGFVGPFLIVSAATFLVCFLVGQGYTGIVLDGTQAQVDAIVTLLLLGSSLASVYVIAKEEHTVRAKVLLPLRVLLGLASGIAVVVAAEFASGVILRIPIPAVGSWTAAPNILLEAACWLSIVVVFSTLIHWIAGFFAGRLVKWRASDTHEVK